MQIVPRPPSLSCTTYERIQRMSLDISSSPTFVDLAAAACRSSAEPQPLDLRIAYSFMLVSLRFPLARPSHRDDRLRRSAQAPHDPTGGASNGRRTAVLLP